MSYDAWLLTLFGLLFLFTSARLAIGVSRGRFDYAGEPVRRIENPRRYSLALARELVGLLLIAGAILFFAREDLRSTWFEFLILVGMTAVGFWGSKPSARRALRGEGLTREDVVVAAVALLLFAVALLIVRWLGF